MSISLATRLPLRRSVWIVLAFVAVTTMVPAAGVAQSLVTTSHTYTYGQTAIFTLSLPASWAVDEATLYLRQNNGETHAFSVPVVAGYGEYRRDLNAQPFLPFARLVYWWAYDLQSERRETERREFIYEDNRIRWQRQVEGNIVLHWRPPDLTPEAVLCILDAARQTQERVGAELNVTPFEGEMHIYIYPSREELAQAMRLTGQGWMGAHTYPETGVILMAMAPQVELCQRYVPHEVTHKVLYDHWGDLPFWLEEGLATYFERVPDPQYERLLNIVTREQLLPLTQLCYGDLQKDDRTTYLLAYAQSWGLVVYIKNHYGLSSLRELLDRYADGLSCVAGVRQVLHVAPETLEQQWWRYVRYGESASPKLQLRLAWQEVLPWLLVAGLSLLPGFIAAMRYAL